MREEVVKQIRTTKYTVAVRWHMRRMGHATNVELLELLHKKYPKVSATTLHLLTTRMVERGELQIAPPGQEMFCALTQTLANTTTLCAPTAGCSVTLS